MVDHLAWAEGYRDRAADPLPGKFLRLASGIATVCWQATTSFKLISKKITRDERRPWHGRPTTLAFELCVAKALNVLVVSRLARVT